MPRPAIFTFHFTFSVSLQVVGGLPFGAMPLASGPRHCGQLAEASLPAPEAGPVMATTIPASKAHGLNNQLAGESINSGRT
jgi:hypothetical protein